MAVDMLTFREEELRKWLLRQSFFRSDEVQARLSSFHENPDLLAVDLLFCRIEVDRSTTPWTFQVQVLEKFNCNSAPGPVVFLQKYFSYKNFSTDSGQEEGRPIDSIKWPIIFRPLFTKYPISFHEFGEFDSKALEERKPEKRWSAKQKTESKKQSAVNPLKSAI